MGNVKMQKIDLCVIQDDDLAQVFLDMDQRPAVKTVVVIDQIVPPNSPKVSALHKALREKAEKEGLDFYYGKGMCAELLANGLLKADESAVVCDKAAGAAGAVGAVFDAVLGAASAVVVLVAAGVVLPALFSAGCGCVSGVTTGESKGASGPMAVSFGVESDAVAGIASVTVICSSSS